MRPKSIVNFERVVILSILLGIVASWLSWDKMQAAMVEAQHGRAMFGTNFAIAIQVIVILIILLLVWLIARKANVVAKWIYVVLAVLGLIFAILGLRNIAVYGTAAMVIGIVRDLLSIASLWLLFRPDSNAWFNEGRAADPTTFQ